MSTERAKEAARKWLRRDSSECYFSYDDYCLDDRVEMVEEVAELLDSYATSERLDELKEVHRRSLAKWGSFLMWKRQRIAALERTAKGESQ